jgi:peptide/nickel transport system permease protein
MTQAAEVFVPQEFAPRQAGGFVRAVGKAAGKNPLGAAAGVCCILLIVLAIIGPSIAPYDPSATDFPRLQAPSASHPFGTDNLFRDMLSRVIVGARNSLGIGFASIAIATVFGVALGLTAGYTGGVWDQTVGRAVDVVIAYPTLVFVIFFLTIFPTSYLSICLAIGVILTPGFIRVVRSATLGVRHQPFIEAAISIGNSPLRTMYRHVLPNVAAPIIVIATVQLGIAILIEATISFLGLGVSSAQNPSWGRMLQETRPVWQAAWWTAIVPGLAISAAVLSFNLFGDALRDALDPRLRGGR